MTHVFWDFNGTVLDDLDLCFDLLNEMLEEVGNKPITKEKYLDIFTFPIKDYYEKVFDLEKHSFDLLANRFIHSYQPKSLELKLHKNVIEAINYFKSKGIKNILLSASEKNRLIEQLNHYKIFDCFDDVLGTENIYASSKLKVAENYFVENHIKGVDALFIGDTLHDAHIAEALNANVILYTKGHQSAERLAKYQLIDDFKSLIR